MFKVVGFIVPCGNGKYDLAQETEKLDLTTNEEESLLEYAKKHPQKNTCKNCDKPILETLTFRIEKFGITLFVLISHTQSLEGVTSLQEDDLHTPFFDIDNCSLDDAVSSLEELQITHNLSDIFVTSDKERSFRVWCFCHVNFSDYLKMQLELLDKKLLDYNFFWWTVKQGKATLRTSSKRDRPIQKVVALLPSYEVPIPDTCERVVYDTGLDEKGVAVFLGNGGKIQ
jgi:hypothetical protein